MEKSKKDVKKYLDENENQKDLEQLSPLQKEAFRMARGNPEDILKYSGQAGAKAGDYVVKNKPEEAIKREKLEKQFKDAIGISLEKLYENRKIRTEQVRKASENIRTSVKEKENPKTYEEEGAEYDE